MALCVRVRGCTASVARAANTQVYLDAFGKPFALPKELPKDNWLGAPTLNEGEPRSTKLLPLLPKRA